MSREVLIIGDSNVRRFYNKLGRQVKSLEFVQARDYDEAMSALPSIKPGYRFIVFAFITNLVVNAGEEDHAARINCIREMLNSLFSTIS